MAERRRPPVPPIRPRPYSFQALADRLGLTAYATGARLGVTGSTLADYRTRGLTDITADHLATRAGLHPSQVWDTWIDDGLGPLDHLYLTSGWRQAWLWNETAA